MKIYTKENIGEFLFDLGNYYNDHLSLPDLDFKDIDGDWCRADELDIKNISGVIDDMIRMGVEWRFKLKTMIINAEVPAPMDEMPKDGGWYFMIDYDGVVGKRKFISKSQRNKEIAEKHYKSGNCFYSCGDAKAYRDAVFPKFKEGE